MSAQVFKLRTFRPLADIVERVRGEERFAFLDSSMPGAQGRYSILGLFPYLVIEHGRGGCLVDGVAVEGDFFDVVKKRLGPCDGARDPRLPLTGGAIGYLGYDFGRESCGVPTRHDPVAATPEASMVFYDLLLIEDVRSRSLFCCCQGRTMTAAHALTWAQDLVDSCPPAPHPARRRSLAPCSCDFTRAGYGDALARLVDHLRAGDAYVVNMAQRLRLKTSGSPYAIYRYLRTHNPAPFSAYLRAPGLDVCCSSMERFMEIRSGHVVTRPIKGTRPRGGTPDEDRANREELARSEKDHSELLMVVDLERNDLSIVCEPGSVGTDPDFAIETYPSVFHLVATVEGTLRKDRCAVDAVRAAFPTGSITGAPKVRAMQIIDELERAPRGLYTGSIGYFSDTGDCDFNVVIRTIVREGGGTSLGVGGGITVESDFDFEYDETMQKARALREAASVDRGSVGEYNRGQNE